MKKSPSPILFQKTRVALWVAFTFTFFCANHATSQDVTVTDSREVKIENLIEEDTALPVIRALIGCESIIQSNPAILDRKLSLAIQLCAYDFHESAVRVLQEILRADPTIHECHYRLGYSLELLGKVDEALVEFQRYLELEPQQSVTLYRIGELLNRNGDIESSNEYLLRYLEGVPDCPAGKRRIGQNLITLNKPAEAIQYLESTLDRFPRDRGSLTALSQAFLRSGQKEKTIPLQETLKKLRNSELVSTPVNLADPLMQRLNQLDKTPAFCSTAALELESKGQYASANVYLELAIDGSPDSTNLFRRYGSNCAKLGQNEQAFKAYHRALQLDPTDSSTLYQRASLFFGMGRLAEAENDLNKLLSLNPVQPNGLTLKSQIESLRKRSAKKSVKEGN